MLQSQSNGIRFRWLTSEGAKAGLVAQPERERQIRRDLPLVACMERHIPTSKATIDVPDRLLVLTGPAEPDIADGVAPEIVVEDVLTTMNGAFKAVDLPAHRHSARSQVMLPSAMTQLGRVLECVTGAVNRDDRARPEKLQSRRHPNQWSNSRIVRDKERPHSVVARRCIHCGDRGPIPLQVTRALWSWWWCSVLPADELKRLHLLCGELVAEHEAVAVSGEDIQARRQRIVVDRLRRVRIQRAAGRYRHGWVIRRIRRSIRLTSVASLDLRARP